MNEEIKALKDKLPQRGYTKLIIAEIPKKGRKPLVNSSMIRQFFAGRPVAYANKVIIVKGVKEAIKKLEKQNNSLKKMMQV